MKKVLFAGDGSLLDAAAYLGGAMTYYDIFFEHLKSDMKLRPGLLEKPYSLIILSDYPRSNISEKAMQRLVSMVKSGTGFLMIGGWESFHGKSGGYSRTTIEDILPVTCITSDDRNNYCHGLVPMPCGTHPALGDLPWEEPPVVCGYNRVIPKKDAETIMNLRALKINGGHVYLDDEDIPFLVLGKYFKGKTAALTTDLAPHWAGGLVDWGDKRIACQAEGGRQVEIGEYYAEFINSLINWFL